MSGRSGSKRHPVGRCPACGKLSFSCKADARKARREMRDPALNVYRCPSGYWHLGHLPSVVQRGALPRTIVRKGGR
jgi:hypothetical protein